MNKYSGIRYLQIFLIASTIIGVLSCKGNTQANDSEQAPSDTIVQEAPVMQWGIAIENFDVKYDTIRMGQTLAEVLAKAGFNAQQIHGMTQCPDSIFNVRKIRAGQRCAIISKKEHPTTPLYFIYEESPKEYVKIDINNQFKTTRGQNPIEWHESEIAGTINSSLWVAMQESGTSPLLAVELSHIFGWSVDFFGIQKGDEFRLIYAQEFADEKPLNNYRVLAASFRASDSTVYAIPFTQDGEELFYNIDGNSLEGAFLKAPLDYYRISSRFSNSRYHPVLKRYRAHHGVDYAAPKGTPVYAIGNGKVIDKGYQARGGGNFVKIRHNSMYVTTYMHLSKFAKGLKIGDAVKQKQVIGYVGSTGLSTGPHLDFRVHENGKPINPLTIKSQPKKPISDTNRLQFGIICDSLTRRLKEITPPMHHSAATNDIVTTETNS